ncbi:hypothetical protein [Evansella tamaricis]|uniref:Uncharacterized protein n=1 Tax=Evansella tamaricis TaxID=2069301 RepID=A0ABS6JDA6_9BACI|nr:hypothetical protein [Evansella tamaricis]MBU9711655.1 hypothetical protein [Evansella tamaricis]
MLVRIDSAITRLNGLILDVIKELEEGRLFYDGPWVMPKGALGPNSYHPIVTASAFSEW